MVMVSTFTTETDSNMSLAAAQMSLGQGQQDSQTSSSSAYEFTHGLGGASGKLSIVAMHGTSQQPSANVLFPKLMKHAFELEVALCPNREPSSTLIAINRNAQFRPHTDIWRGRAGQSTSLIVGLSDFFVEGEKKDIRHKGLEFNGWKQRHRTTPFQANDNTLVWFTPEGMRRRGGIDICQG